MNHEDTKTRRSRRLLIVAGLAVCHCLQASAQDQPKAADPAASAAQATPAPAPAPPLNVGGRDSSPDTGTVAGIVRFEGELLPSEPIREVFGNAFCHEHHQSGAEPVQESWVFGKNGTQATLRNVLVHVVKGLGDRKFDPPAHAVLLDQVGCLYVPHVVAGFE